MEGADTSYLLKYDKSGHRTLSLREKGYPVPQNLVPDPSPTHTHTHTWCVSCHVSCCVSCCVSCASRVGLHVPQVLKHVGRPDAILFVPVAGEFDETLVVRLLSTFFSQIYSHSHLIYIYISNISILIFL
jgi:hypothetical protein